MSLAPVDDGPVQRAKRHGTRLCDDRKKDVFQKLCGEFSFQFVEQKRFPSRELVAICYKHVGRLCVAKKREEQIFFYESDVSFIPPHPSPLVSIRINEETNFNPDIFLQRTKKSGNMTSTVADSEDLEEILFIERQSSYVFGSCERNAPLIIVLSPTKRGWTSRSTSRHNFNHDYVSYETLDQVQGWLAFEEFRPLFITDDREEALERLSSLVSSMGVGDPSPTGYLECDPTLASVERAERVLQHLELSRNVGSLVREPPS